MVQKQQNKPDPSHPESNMAHPLVPQKTESQASPGTPGDSDAGGGRPTL